MKIILISLFSCVWLMAVGQQEEKIDKEEEENVFITPVSYMPIFGTCIDDSLSYQEMKKCSDEAFLEFFYSNLKLPTVHFSEIPKAKRAIVQFMINKDGIISNVLFLRPSHEALEKEILGIVDFMPKWKPAMYKGEPTEVCFTFPFRIHLR